MLVKYSPLRIFELETRTSNTNGKIWSISFHSHFTLISMYFDPAWIVMFCFRIALQLPWPSSPRPKATSNSWQIWCQYDANMTVFFLSFHHCKYICRKIMKTSNKTDRPRMSSRSSSKMPAARASGWRWKSSSTPGWDRFLPHGAGFRTALEFVLEKTTVLFFANSYYRILLNDIIYVSKKKHWWLNHIKSYENRSVFELQHNLGDDCDPKTRDGRLDGPQECTSALCGILNKHSQDVSFESKARKTCTGIYRDDIW